MLAFVIANPIENLRTIYQWQPVVPLVQPWQIGIGCSVLIALIVFIFWLSWRDSIQQPAPLRILWLLLRLVAVAGIVVYTLHPGQRSETRIVKDSRLAVLFDTSLSMGLSDLNPTVKPPTQESRNPDEQRSPAVAGRRIDEIVQWLTTSTSLEPFRNQHEIAAYRFGEADVPELIVTLPKINSAQSDSTSQAIPASVYPLALHKSRIVGWLALSCGGLGLLSFLLLGYRLLVIRSNASQTISAKLTEPAMLWAVGTASAVALLIGLAVSDLLTPEQDWLASIGWRSINQTNAETFQSATPTAANAISTSTSSTTATTASALSDIDWETELAVRGTSTRIGEAVQSIVNQERGGPIAAIILITDGRNTGGISPLRAMAAAESIGVPIFPIGIGSNEVPRNVKVADIQAPQRVFPGDKFLVKGIIKSSGLAGTTIQVQLISVDEKNTEAETIENETTVRLLEDGLAVPFDFNVQQTELGKRRYTIRTANVAGDLDLRDNERSVVVEVIDRQTKVLLMAGGPLREFQFLRNQLYRDKDVNLHVWLQSAQAGADQEADVMLSEFPTTREQLFEFDCIVAFDPDWRALSIEQANLLERWVAEQAGGLVVIAGPVNTPEWTRKPRGDEITDQIRRLYPVSFYSQGSAQLKLGRFGGEEPFPLGFSRAGRAAEFLWLGETAAESQANWDRFSGVFGYYAVNEPKPGADVLANFSDPETAIDDRQPIYLASQYYGAGRVFFQASGEMWRIRRYNVDAFQQYYTKLVRWASAGRLLRDSTRGVLLTDRERCWMGDQVTVQAMLRTLQDEPLMVGEVTASLLKPDGSSERLTLRAAKNAVRPGTYSAQLTPLAEGEYRISLPIPDSSELEILTTTVQASIPDLEQEKPQRNDELLAEMAEKTSGHYYVGLASFTLPDSDPLAPQQLIQSQDQITFLTGTSNPIFHRKLMQWLFMIVVFVLTAEWTIRRLHKLA